MAEKTYARLVGGTVMELVTTSADITHLFHPSLHWMDVTGQTVAIGWQLEGTNFTAPAAPVSTAAAPHVPTLAELQVALAALTARFGAYQAAQAHA